jgi:pyridoxine 4-dehydrogenase
MAAAREPGPHTVGILAGCPVGRIGYGAMQLTASNGPDRDRAVALLHRAIELGVNHIDTAEFYGAGATNDIIRTALHPYPNDLVLVSKVGAEHDPDTGIRPAQRPAELRSAVEANLKSLDVEQLGVVNLRRMDARPGIVAEGDQLIDLDSQLSELVDLRQEGKIGAIGLSNVDLGQITQALPVGLACVQNAYSLLDRTAESVLTLCAAHEVAWVPFFPLGSAFPGLPKVTEHPKVIATAAGLGVTPSQVGLAWLLAHDPHTLLIPGTSSATHLEENVAADRLVLDAGVMAALNRIGGEGA